MLLKSCDNKLPPSRYDANDPAMMKGTGGFFTCPDRVARGLGGCWGDYGILGGDAKSARLDPASEVQALVRKGRIYQQHAGKWELRVLRANRLSGNAEEEKLRCREKVSARTSSLTSKASSGPSIPSPPNQVALISSSDKKPIVDTIASPFRKAYYQMPGTIAVLTHSHDGKKAADIADALLREMHGSPEAEAIPNGEDDSLAVRLVHPKGTPSGFGRVGDALVSWFGIPRYQNRPFSEKVIEELHEQKALEDPERWAGLLTGHFQVLAYFPKKRWLYVLVDKTSTMPLYWASFPGGIAVAPEPLAFRALTQVGKKLSVRQGAVYEYLASGHLWGDGSFWNEVQRLGPGHGLFIRENEPRARPYWTFRIEPEKGNSKWHIDRLRCAILEDVRALPEGRGALLLSGGYDSRGLLGLLKQLGRDFEPLSYSFGDEYAQGFDQEIGGYYARKIGAGHRAFVPDLGNTEQILREFDRAIQITGGEADTATSQFGFLGEACFDELAREFDYVIRGDEVWGWSDYVLTCRMAFWQTFFLELNHIPQAVRLLCPESFLEGSEHLAEQRQLALAEARKYGCTEPNALKDFLYWRYREARLIQSVAYYGRWFVPHYAPFLFGRSLKVVRSLPCAWRSRKRAFMKTMETMFPQLFLDATRPTKMAPKRSRFRMLYQRPEFREFIQKHLVQEPPRSLSTCIQEEALKPWLEEIFSSQQSNLSNKKHYNAKRKLYDLVRHNRMALAASMAILEAAGKSRFPVVNENYLYRLLTLARTLKYYESASNH